MNKNQKLVLKLYSILIFLIYFVIVPMIAYKTYLSVKLLSGSEEIESTLKLNILLKTYQAFLPEFLIITLLFALIFVLQRKKNLSTSHNS
jgi:hypothetical protein